PRRSGACCRGTDAAAARGADSGPRPSVSARWTSRMPASGYEGEFRVAEHGTAPGPQEPGVARMRPSTHAHQVLRIRLERRGRRGRDPLEVRQPRADRVEVFGRPRVFDAAVDAARHLIPARQVVEADRRAERHARDRPVEPGRAAPQFQIVGERRRQAALNRVADVGSHAIGEIERDEHLPFTRERGHRDVARGVGRHEREAERECGDYSFGFNRAFSSLANSLMSRKCRYTDAKRTYATLSSFFSSSITNPPISAVAISFSGRSCSVASTRSATASSAATLTGRFSQAFNRPLTSFWRSKRSRVPSFFTTM